MTSNSIIAWIERLKQTPPTDFKTQRQPAEANHRSVLSAWTAPPAWVQQSAVAQRYLSLLGALAWAELPERESCSINQPPPISYAAFIAAYLVKLDQHLVSMGRLRQYLLEHPALIWLFGFPVVTDLNYPHSFNPEASLPTQRHFTRLLRQLPNPVLQQLLDNSVALIQAEVSDLGLDLGQTISLDTKHIIAWVKENNPKAYLKNGRYDKTQQPKGDPDCRLGCKRRHNQRTTPVEAVSTPTTNPRPADTLSVGEYYWGYASGVVATKLPQWGEVILAELTQPFDQPDVSYFYPLLADTERRLGFRPKYAALDAAFDAFYIYEYFYAPDHDGFAAVPFCTRGGHRRCFDNQGQPLCQAGLAMPLKHTFWCKSTLVAHERGRYACPLRYPEPTGQACPINHKRWPKGGCLTTLPTSIGARLRYQIDRDSDRYKQVYNQRTANERINSQAKALGIERPQLRNQRAIANLNTLIYLLINLRTLHRIRQRKAEVEPSA